MNDDEVYDKARKRVEAKIGFYIHAGIFVCISAFLIGINLAVTPENLWFVWPFAGWGIGVFIHGLTVFVFSSGGKAKQRMVEREVERQQAVGPQGGSHGVPNIAREEDLDSKA